MNQMNKRINRKRRTQAELISAMETFFKRLLDVEEMTNGLESEPFRSFESPCQEMPLQGHVCASDDAVNQTVCLFSIV